MKPNSSIVLGWLIGSLLCCFCQAKAQDVVPCLIFTGNSDTEYCIDLAKLNRITFGDDGMTISSSNDNSIQDVQLLYSLFHHLEIGDATPSMPSGLNDIEASSSSILRFQADTKSIVIESDSTESFQVGIINPNGTLVAKSKIFAGQSLSVESLSSGVYIAIASNGETNLSIKFILK